MRQTPQEGVLRAHEARRMVVILRFYRGRHNEVLCPRLFMVAAPDFYLFTKIVEYF